MVKKEHYEPKNLCYKLSCALLVNKKKFILTF